MHLRFTFDFISPYAYFAWTQIRDLADRNDCTVSFEPVLFAAMLNAWGHKGPAEIPPKKVFTAKQTARRAARLQLPFRWPAAHPFNPLKALRVSLPDASGEHQAQVIDALFGAIWGEGIDAQSADALQEALDRAGLPGQDLLARTADPAIKQTLIDTTRAAIDRGLWGVPSIEIEQEGARIELFWGEDSLRDVEAVLRGEDPIDSAAVDAMIRQLPTGSSRKRNPSESPTP